MNFLFNIGLFKIFLIGSHLFFDHVVEFTPIFQHPRIGGPGLVGRYEFPDGYVE